MLEFPNIDPVAFSLGPFSVRWYALAYLAGFILGWRYCLYLVGVTGREQPSRTDIDDYLVWAIVAVILGGRLGYILFYQFELYLENPVEIFKIWRGGMAYHGGVIGIIVSLIVFARVRGFPMVHLSDLIACAAPIGVFFGRIANFINGELYGRVTDHSWGMVFPHGGPDPRHPSQLYEAALEGGLLFLILLVLVHRKEVRNRPGILSGVFLLGYATFRMLVENVREPDPQLGLFFFDVSMGQMLSLPMAALGAGFIIWALRRPAQQG